MFVIQEKPIRRYNSLNMKKQKAKITSTDELSKSLSYSSPVTWIVLGASVLLLIGFFVWSFVFDIQIKSYGTAHIDSGVATLKVEESAKDSLKEGQKVYISGVEGKILSIDDGKPVVSAFALADGDYDYYIIIREIKPIQFWLNNN